MLQILKTINGADRVNLGLFLNIITESSNRGHDQKYVKRHAHPSRSVFNQRVVNDWHYECFKIKIRYVLAKREL